MPIKWTPEMDQHMLLVVLTDLNIDNKSIATAYRNSCQSKGLEQPTERAVIEHLYKLRSQTGVKGKSGGTSGPNTPKTPRTPKTPKTTKRFGVEMTPSASGKRKRANVPMSGEEDDDDSEPEIDAKLATKLGRRAVLGRSSKNAARQYNVDDDVEEEADGRSEGVAVKREGGDHVLLNGAASGVADSAIDLTGGADSGEIVVAGAQPSPKKKTGVQPEELENDSDVSSFSASKD